MATTFTFTTLAPVRETAKAYGFDATYSVNADGTRNSCGMYVAHEMVWLPKSQVNVMQATPQTLSEREFDVQLYGPEHVIVSVPGWLAYKNNYFEDIYIQRYSE